MQIIIVKRMQCIHNIDTLLGEFKDSKALNGFIMSLNR
jgi:hypothetical protein